MTLPLRYRIDKALNRERSLAVTTRIGCVNACAYCPQDVFVKAYRKRSAINLLDPDLFQQCLQKLPKHIIVVFAGFSEPFQHSDCARLIRTAHEAGHLIRVNTSGIGMQPSDPDALSDIPFLKFVIHLPDSAGISKIRVDTDYLHTIERLATSGLQNLDWKFHRTSQQEEVHPEVLNILNTHGIRIRLFGLSDRAGNVNVPDRGQRGHLSGSLYPCKDFGHNILFPNGEVGLCHMDWGLQHVLGNLAEVKTYRDLYRQAEMRHIRCALRDDTMPLQCRQCEKAGPRAHGLPGIFPAWLMRSKHGNLYED